MTSETPYDLERSGAGLQTVLELCQRRGHILIGGALFANLSYLQSKVFELLPVDCPVKSSNDITHSIFKFRELLLRVIFLTVLPE